MIMNNDDNNDWAGNKLLWVCKQKRGRRGREGNKNGKRKVEKSSRNGRVKVESSNHGGEGTSPSTGHSCCYPWGVFRRQTTRFRPRCYFSLELQGWILLLQLEVQSEGCSHLSPIPKKASTGKFVRWGAIMHTLAPPRGPPVFSGGGSPPHWGY